MQQRAGIDDPFRALIAPMRNIVSVIAISFALFACKSDDKAGSEKSDKESVGKVTTPEKAPTKKRVKLAEEKVSKLVDAWLAAQNSGDFDAYSTLYAKKFNGVKRVGAKTTRYARKDWLADRKRMFKKKMKVEANDRSYSLSYISGQVSFKQRWASGKYEDLGPKRILAVLEDGALKIAQEEMIASEVVRSKDDVKGSGLYFMYGSMMILHDAPVPEKHGKPILEGGDPITTVATVADADLDAKVLAWKGKKVRVDGECEATVKGFQLMSRVVVHFGTEQMWNCDDGSGDDDSMGEDCKPASEAERAAEAFSEGGPVVMAELSDCDGTYARAADRAKMVIGETVKDPALVKKATVAFAKLKSVTEQSEAGNEDWWGEPQVNVFRHPKSGQVLVSAYADNGGMCGEFSASSWQIWEHKGGKLVPIKHGSAPEEIFEAVDSDDNGSLEFVVKGDEFGTERALIDAKTLEQHFSVGYSYNDCPC